MEELPAPGIPDLKSRLESVKLELNELVWDGCRDLDKKSDLDTKRVDYVFEAYFAVKKAVDNLELLLKTESNEH